MGNSIQAAGTKDPAPALTDRWNVAGGSSATCQGLLGVLVVGPRRLLGLDPLIRLLDLAGPPGSFTGIGVADVTHPNGG